MSCYEWAAGDIVLPATEFNKMLKTFQAETKARQDRAFNVCQDFWKSLTPKQKRDKQAYGEARWTLLEKYGDESMVSNILPYENKRLTQAQCKPITSRTTEFWGSDLNIVFHRKRGNYHKANSVRYEVNSNNHAREFAERTWQHSMFFTLMGMVQWTSRSGGVIVGNDEYNDDGGGIGGGGNYVLYVLGPAGKREAKRAGVLV